MQTIYSLVRSIVQRYATLTPAAITPFREFSAPAFTMSSNTLPGITAIPTVDQHISHNGKDYTTVKEGLAYILIPAEASKVPQTAPQGDNQTQSVFYNPIQQFNRDLSVLAIKAYGEDVIARKQKALEVDRRKVSDKRKEKKRKREESFGDAPRKAGKIEGSNTVSDMIPESTIARDAAIEDPSAGKPDESIVASDVEPQAGEPEDPEIAQRKGESESQSEEQKPNPPSKPRNPTFTVLDALSATGLRALRYAIEIPFTTSVTANDLLPAATKTIKLNVEHNKLEEKIKAVIGNAVTHMYNLLGEKCKDDKGRTVQSRKYDVIDLDPYGTAVPFLDAAVQSVRDDGGLLCVTCTDAGVWASNGYPEKAYSLYGGVPIKGMHSHEGGLRLILHSIASTAARYGLAIEPLLSLSIDFYARVFVRIHKSPADVKFLAGKTMVVYNCDTGCGAWTTQMVAKNKLAQNKSGKGYFWKHVFEQAPSRSENCVHCGMKTHMAGPMYAGPLHSPEFIKKILDGLPSVSKDTYQTTERIEGMLSMALEESLPPLEENPDSPTLTSKTKRYDPAAIDLYPFFFIPSVLAKVVHCITPHENALRGALRHLGYRVTRSHTKPGSIKTDAPWEVIWEVMREWVKQKAPVKEGAIRRGTAGWNIIGLERKETSRAANKESNNGDAGEFKDTDGTSDERAKPEIVFDEALGKEKDGKKLVRFQLNPRENWGPMNRAKGHS
jgi:tRNA (guanine26-N2/guanine27-N2)-dimethyltransferase